MNIKDLVKDGKKASFTHYFDGNLWYQTEDGFSFPVPVEDIGTATFNCVEKALLMMRYIRKHIETLKGNENV